MSEANGSTATEVRHDGILLNALTGLGDPAVDRSQHTTVGWHTRLTKWQLEELGCNWICNNIVSAYPDEATREWLEITLGGDNADPKLIQAFDSYQERLRVKEKFRWADYLANLYRGAAIVVVAEDGQDAKEPLRRDRIRTIRKLEVLDCHKIMPELTGGMDPLEPEFYRLVIDPLRYKDLQEMGVLVHHTRVIRFEGVQIPPDAMMYSQPAGWGLSRLELIYDAFRDYESVFASTAEMAGSYNVFKMAIQGMATALKVGGIESERMLQARFAAIQQMMSAFKGIVVDADKESVDFINRNFAGVAEILDRFAGRMVGASDLPYTILFGRGPQGLAAQGTGDSEDSVWAKRASQYQEVKYRPRFQGVAELIWLAKDGPSKGKIPDDWSFGFRSLVKETPKSQMELRSLAAQTYNTYVQMGSLDPEEIRESQFGGSEYSIEITLDKELWEKKKQEQLGGFGDFGGFGAEPEGEAETQPTPGEGDQPAAPSAPAQSGFTPQAQQDSVRTDVSFRDEDLHRQAIAETKNRYKIYPSLYANQYMTETYKKLFKQKHGTLKGAFAN